MSSFKKIAWSGSAVLLALVMALGLMAPKPAEAAVTVTSVSGNVWNGAMGANFAPLSNLVIKENAAGEITAGTLILTNATASVVYQDAGVCTISGQATGGTLTCAAAFAANTLTLTFAGSSAAAATPTPATVTLSSIEATTAATAIAEGPINIASSGTSTVVPAATSLGTITAARLVLGTVGPGVACTVGVMAPGTFAADPLAQGGALCASLATAAGAVMATVPITFTVSTGVVSTGTAKTVTAFTASTGIATTNYRGSGGAAGTDTALATNTSLNLVGTVNITLTAPTGNTASKMTIQSPTVLAIAPTVTNTTPNYQSPKKQTNLSVQVTDAAGQGVNNEVLLLSTDKGALVQGFDATCGTAKAVTATTASGPLTLGGDVKSGVVPLTYCANQLDGAGKATITAQNVSTSMANQTVSVSHAGRPNKVEVTATGNAVSVKVSDAGGNPVADDTPIRFTMSSNAGAVSTACTTSSNGAASAVVALIAPTGTVIVSTDWNETGAFATCAAAGSQQVAASVTVPGGTATSGGGTAGGGTGALTSGSVPATGFGLIVFGGGTVAQLVTASGVGNSGALYATVGGNFVPYVPGTTIAAVNADFLAAFPGGNVPANTAFVGRK